MHWVRFDVPAAPVVSQQALDLEVEMVHSAVAWSSAVARAA